MGSCYSSLHKGAGKRRDILDLDIIHRRKGGLDEGGGGEKGKLFRQVEIPGRICMNGASKIACLYTQQGKKGTNQDAMLVWEVSIF